MCSELLTLGLAPALTVEEADEVIGKARELGRLLTVNTQYRHMAIYNKTREALGRG